MLICVFNNLIAQSENCTHNVSTNFQNPSNGSIPFNSILVGDEYLNHFDWNALNSSGFLTTYQLQNMTYNQNMINIQSVASGPYYSYLYSGEKMSYENGWELLLLNIGRFPNLDPLPNSDYADIPYIVLYNRFKGIIRLFANYGNGYISTNSSINAMRVQLRFDNDLNGIETLNGLMRLSAGKDFTLDQNTNVSKMSATAYHPNAANKWFSCDFQVAYDPCICYYPSSLRLDFFAVENQNLELHGRQISIEQNLISGKAINQQDFLSNFDYTGNSVDGGILMYKALDYLVADYEAKIDDYRAKLAQVNEHNAQLDKSAFVIKAFKSIVLSGGSSLVSSVLNSSWVVGLADNINEFAKIQDNDTLIDIKKIKEDAKKVLSKEINTFFTESFKKQDLPTAPASPSATFSEMHFQGNLSTITPTDGPYFYTPGTYGSEGTGSPELTEFSKYPIYNEALGIFALLETPKLIRSYHHEIIGVNNFAFETKNKMQFKLAEPLKYYFNPALNYQSKKISAMLQFDVINKDANYIRNGQQDYKIFDNSVNLFSESINTYSNSLLYDYDSDANGQGSIVGEYKYRKDTLKYDSGFLPLDIFNDFVVELGTKESQIVPTGDALQYYNYYEANGFQRDIWQSTGIDVKLKLLIDVIYSGSHENGAPHEYTYVFTYDIDNNNIMLSNVELYPHLESSIGNIHQYVENLNYDNTTFNGTQIKGCKLVGNKYTCQSWNDININGNINVVNGYKVDFIAGNLISVNPESTISNESTLSIQPILNFSNPIAESSPTYVKEFCKGTNPNAPAYRANIPTKRILDLEALEANDSINEENSNIDFNWDFELYPNPTNMNSTVKLLGNYDENVQILVYNVAGNLVLEAIIEDRDSKSFDISKLNKGIYFVGVNSNGITKTKQLVVQ
jgi:hypothetical protein